MAKYNYIFEIDSIINDAKQGVCPGEEEIKVLEDLKDKIKALDENKIEGQISYLANERDGSKELRAKLPIGNLSNEFDFGEKVDIIILKK